MCISIYIYVCIWYYIYMYISYDVYIYDYICPYFYNQRCATSLCIMYTSNKQRMCCTVVASGTTWWIPPSFGSFGSTCGILLAGVPKDWGRLNWLLGKDTHITIYVYIYTVNVSNRVSFLFACFCLSIYRCQMSIFEHCWFLSVRHQVILFVSL